MLKKLMFLIVLFAFVSMKSDKPAYRIYDQDGKKTHYSQLLKDASQADIVMFGEMHDNPIVHWLEYELTADLYAEKKNNLVLGAEMFETDNQLIINEYLSGSIKDANFEKEARLWPNYKTDYKPLLRFARDSSLVFVATNIPRRYASLVNKDGFEALNAVAPEGKQLFAPLPVKYDPELDCYKEIGKAMGNSPMHGTDNIAKAQAIKDATMAYFILKNFKKGQTFLHFNGSYHSDRFQGIVWYLLQADPTLKIVTITSAQQKNICELAKETKGQANFIIAVPETMTKTQ